MLYAYEDTPGSSIMQEKIQNTIKNLIKNHMTGYYAASKEELYALLERFMPRGQIVGCGDSVTLEQTGTLDFVRSGPYHFLDKYQPGLTHQEKRGIYLQNFRADTFLTGVNAITVDGKLFNIDGNGSRVAPTLYGPKQVIVVAGTNKLTNSVEEAIFRARQIAAPLDAQRLEKDTPCAKLGRCIDCRHPQRICNDFVLITGQFDKERIRVILVDGSYGY